jgi:hypothetical protein
MRTYLVEVEDEIELADIAKELIQDFHEGLHEFEDGQLVFVLVNDGYEIETGEALVYYLVLLVVQEIAHLGATCDH